MDAPPRKPLAQVAVEAERESMVMWPMRWPRKFLARADQRAAATGSTRSQVIREAYIAGMISLELEDLRVSTPERRRKTRDGVA